MRTFYLAICLDCAPVPSKPVLSVPFTDKDERETWIKAHMDATGHLVVVTQEDRP